MFSIKKTIISPCDFRARFVRNLIDLTIAMKSHPFIAKGTRQINAKRTLGLLCLDVVKGDEIEITVENIESEEQAEKDLNFILSIIYAG